MSRFNTYLYIDIQTLPYYFDSSSMNTNWHKLFLSINIYIHGHSFSGCRNLIKKRDKGHITYITLSKCSLSSFQKKTVYGGLQLLLLIRIYVYTHLCIFFFYKEADYYTKFSMPWLLKWNCYAINKKLSFIFIQNRNIFLHFGNRLSLCNRYSVWLLLLFVIV